MENLGAEVAAIRKGLGLSQAEFAEILGVTQATVSRWERDRNIQSLTVYALRWMLENDMFTANSQKVLSREPGAGTEAA